MLRDIKMQERKLAIVLLDLIGSTAFVQKHGARRSALHFQVHDRLTRSLLFKFRGREIDRSDGFLCSFESPVDAVNFALHYQRSIPQKIRIGCRIGIHWDKVVEVHQDDVWVAVNAKRIELEGLAKNIAARTMSLSGAGQVLLTEQAMEVVKYRVNHETPRGARYVCVGKYKFKGVKTPQKIFAVGETIESLQPPKDTEKAKRVSGPKKIKVSIFQMSKKEVLSWVWWRLTILTYLFWFLIFYLVISTDEGRYLLGVEWLSWVDHINAFLKILWFAFLEWLPKPV